VTAWVAVVRVVVRVVRVVRAVRAVGLVGCADSGRCAAVRLVRITARVIARRRRRVVGRTDAKAMGRRRWIGDWNW
jgi:hypothetical protein